MELVRVDTQRAYESIKQMIITLKLAPGAPVDESRLSEKLDMGITPVREAIKLLAHDHLIEIPRRGIYVSNINIPDLEKLSEVRLLLESFSARKAALRAGPDDQVVLEILCREMASLPSTATDRYFDLDHKFHENIARAADNKYLAETLEQFYGLSQRLWYMVLPELGFLPAAVEEHLDLVKAIVEKDPDRAEQVMHDHVAEFYAKVHEILSGKA